MKISEVSKTMNITIDTLRYYEKEGLVQNITRINGIRDYSEADVRKINFIKCLRGAGMSMQSLKKYLSFTDEGGDSVEERKNILIEERNKILEQCITLIDVLDLLNHKIHNYEEVILKRENELLG